MKTYDINYSMCELSRDLLRAFGSEDFDLIESVYDDSEKMLSEDWAALYKSLLSGDVDYLTYETGKDKNTGRSLVYLFTRSARQNVQIQKTCFLSVPGSDDLLPVSHRDFRTFDDFRRDGFPDGVTVTAA